MSDGSVLPPETEPSACNVLLILDGIPSIKKRCKNNFDVWFYHNGHLDELLCYVLC